MYGFTPIWCVFTERAEGFHITCPFPSLCTANNWSSSFSPIVVWFLKSWCFIMYPTQVLGMITWKYSVFVLYARLIFTCGQWNRWCERRICHAWLSRARLFLSTFWQDFMCVSCCICWVLNRGVGYRCGAGSTSSYTSHSKTILIDNPVCFIVQCIISEDVCALILTHASKARNRQNQSSD